jgi:hypothetical protein
VTGLLATVALVAIAAGAGAADDPSVTVTPSTGLVEGQSVTVVASGFLAASSSGGTFVPRAFQCAPQFPVSAVFDPTTATTVVDPLLARWCTSLGDFPVTQSTTTSRSVPVTRAFTSPGGESVRCGVAPGDCLIVVTGVQPPSAALASAPISFAATPPSKAACKGGGWRQYVDGDGRPLRNQGQCIRAVRV